ncbi:tetratricopeptide repeat protein [Streptomyces sp. NBC_01728]|uniref:tetratricopeptide repeat protein n=1 Tax=unclassified Streptomyces TaxID=2593676 RepID=UPI002258C139|nr:MULTISPECIES: tetratricopeptide repeat protein [unclassified Streptomyces]MCX4460821.1 tetratricopeptide repeat protein [Streptomyces sp. NBC_01719]MCX4499849.1 tetratricopeptide repeat protein [Streptomyces sp. NBC_01728]
MTGASPQEREPVTTNGTIAVTNLHGQIDGLAVRLSRAGTGETSWAPFAVAQGAALIDLLNLRGHILGRVADYEQAAELAEQLVHVAPEDGTALLARARTRATLHRFAEAVADLGAAARSGADETTLDAERAVVLQALGCYTDATAVIHKAAERQSDFTTLGSLAVLQAERGQVTEAEQLFSEARHHYQGTSPFPLAQLDFRCGVMWHREGDLDAARSFYEAARRRVPDYAPALGHLAEVELLRGEPHDAVALLRPLTRTSDDPEYAGHLAAALHACDRVQEANQWRERAAARYDELVLCHPEAYADHAADFWLTVGADAERGLQLALQNLAIRQTSRAHALFQRAVLAQNRVAQAAS